MTGALRSGQAEQAQWLDETIIEIIISEAQNEVADFKKWGFDIIPHRALMKQGFETAGRQAGRCRDRLQESRSIRSASPSSAPCG